MKHAARILSALLICVSAWAGVSRAAQPATFPGATWDHADPGRFGWSAEKLAAAWRLYDTYPPASVVVVNHGRVVAEWGNPALRVKLSSIRKSFLSALIGIYASEGKIDLDESLSDLGIDDDPPLTQTEKTATVRMLLEARSGVYHSFVAGTPAMRAAAPARGSHAPGSLWYYNNWDFNALGSIFEQRSGLKIADAFNKRIAKPLGMQDYRPTDTYYITASSADPAGSSIHPAYHFRLTARDMARFGYLYLHHGAWGSRQIVPADWVALSTTARSVTEPGEGYGYLWWTDGLDLPVKSFSARGSLAKWIVVVPERDLVFVYQNHTELPDNAQSLTPAQVGALPTVSGKQIGALLKLILAAQAPNAARGSP